MPWAPTPIADGDMMPLRGMQEGAMLSPFVLRSFYPQNA